jgi:hypothetical protein
MERKMLEDDARSLRLSIAKMRSGAQDAIHWLAQLASSMGFMESI